MKTLLETFIESILGVDPEVERARKITDLLFRIVEHERQMSFAEMSDDRYYSNGRRDRDKAELLKLKAELQRLTDS